MKEIPMDANFANRKSMCCAMACFLPFYHAITKINFKLYPSDDTFQLDLMHARYSPKLKSIV